MGVLVLLLLLLLVVVMPFFFFFSILFLNIDDNESWYWCCCCCSCCRSCYSCCFFCCCLAIFAIQVLSSPSTRLTWVTPAETCPTSQRYQPSGSRPSANCRIRSLLTSPFLIRIWAGASDDGHVTMRYPLFLWPRPASQRWKTDISPNMKETGIAWYAYIVWHRIPRTLPRWCHES